jgi:hypothetical protein
VFSLIICVVYILTRQSSGTAQKRAAPYFYYKGFPKFTSDMVCFFNSLLFPHLIHIALLRLCKKVKDCETTNGHVGRIARTLMKDARRGLNR